MPQQTSVTTLDLYRIWQENEGLDLEWLLKRLRGEEKTEAMKVGGEFHEALEKLKPGPHDRLITPGYRFDFSCECELPWYPLRESSVEKDYNGLLVRGRVDAMEGLTIIDYKTTERFDPDRYFESYQWRFYLDMTGCDRFKWHVFVLRDLGVDPASGCSSYDIYQAHTLSQGRYPGLGKDCERLAGEYMSFAESLVAQ